MSVWDCSWCYFFLCVPFVSRSLVLYIGAGTMGWEVRWLGWNIGTTAKHRRT